MSGGYVFAVDPFPRTEKEHNRLHPFYEALAENRLTTTRCTRCGHLHWPPQIVCARCLSDQVEWVDLPTTGRVHGFTVQETAVPVGYKAPLIFALVEIQGLRIFTTLVNCSPEAVEVGMPVQLHVTHAPAPPEAAPRPRHTFAPVT